MSKRKKQEEPVTVFPTSTENGEGSGACGHYPTLEDYDFKTDRDAWKSLIQNADAWEALRYRSAARRR